MGEFSQLLEAARKLNPEIVELRRRIHAEPELGLALPETRAKVLEAISGLDLEIRLHQQTGGVAARLRGAHPGRTLALRGDMDALPMPEDTGLEYSSKRAGVMHACGHDSHTAMLVGAAKLLSERRQDLRGDVVFLFQPGEEGHFGARYMIEEGALAGVDAAFALHIAPNMPTGLVGTRAGPLLASADVFEVAVRGRGGHASMPHGCLDPVPVACEIVQALQTFVTRRIPAFEPVVLTVSKIEAGTTNNVIPELAVLEGTLRAVSESSRARAQEGIERLARKIAEAHQAEAEVSLTPGYPPTVNDADFASFVLGVAGELIGPERAIQMSSPLMAAEDFSYVLERVPGAMAFLGIAPEGVAEPAPCHSNRMVLNEDGMPVGTALHAAVALRYLGGSSPPETRDQ